MPPMRGIVVFIALFWGAVAASAAQRDALARARALYNQGAYEQAAAAAREASVPPHADAARVILGRAHLERYRQSGNRDDLTAARDALRAANAFELQPRDRIELLIGLAEALFLEEAFGASAELYESLLPRAGELGPAARDRVLDWWATALDREARGRSREERLALYGRVLLRMEEELARDPAAGAPVYWVSHAACGLGDPERAWSAAVAGWVRAPLSHDRGAALRADLDRLVRQMIVPARVQRLGGSIDESGRDRAAIALLAEWELTKQRWTNR